jgi:hypothetical protein
LTWTEVQPKTDTIWKIKFKVGRYYMGSFDVLRSAGWDHWRAVSLEPFSSEDGQDLTAYSPRSWLWYNLRGGSYRALVEYKLVDCEECRVVPAEDLTKDVVGAYEGKDWEIEKIQV